ncbi:hypothetical protein [Asaia platycodi]|uniref:hypothetical protein n=1 Tax=Asaia platycodi TaxID=610243 RepID=UPI000470247F|nr:hypothetical protein [Asaia platycodi]
METGLIRLIKDIDAIAYNERRGLRVFEFKRKYPARGYYRFQEPAQFGRLPEIPAIRDISPELIKQAAFGLDRGHALTLEVCRKLQIGYVYLILNSIETRPEHFFDESFRSRQPHELLYRSVELRDLVGYHSTDGKDSGSFNRNKRWQYMIDRKVFEEYTLPAG